MAEHQGIEHDEPQRNAGHQQSGQAAGNVLLGIGKREVAAHQQQVADDGELQQFFRAVADGFSANHAIAEHEDARDGEASGAHQGWRYVLDCDVDGEIG